MLGLVGARRSAATASGLAIFTGWALTALCLSVGLVVGISPTLASAAVIWSAAIVVGVLVGRARRAPRVPRPSLREPHLAGRVISWVGRATVCGYLLALLMRAWSPTGVLHPDAWNQWLAKAKVLYFFDGLDTADGGFTSQFNPDYPPLAPASEALTFDALGGANTLELARVHWVLAASFLFGLAWILAPRVRPALLWPSLALLAVAPRFGWLLGSSLADEPLATLIGLAGLTGLIWRLEHELAYALLCGLFLATATATKNEGLMLALVILVALAATLPGRRQLGAIAALAGATLGVYASWRAWLSLNSVPTNPFYDLTDLFRPQYLADRSHRLEYGLGQLLEQFATPSRWLLLVPVTVGLALLAVRRARAVTVFVVTVVVLDTVGFALIYWLSPIGLHFYVDNTVDRLPAFMAVFCGAQLPLVLSVSSPLRSEPHAVQSS
jgi:hypothetical protein